MRQCRSSNFVRWRHSLSFVNDRPVFFGRFSQIDAAGRLFRFVRRKRVSRGKRSLSRASELRLGTGECMLRLRGMMSLAALSGIVGTVGFARGATTLQGVDFSTMITPNQNISDSIFHYGVTGSPTGGSFGLGNYPANQNGTNKQIIQIEIA